LVAVGRDLDLVAWQHSYHAEGRPIGLPALSAAADVIVDGVGGERHLDLVAVAVAIKLAAGEACGTGRDAAVYGGMDGDHVFPPQGLVRREGAWAHASPTAQDNAQPAFMRCGESRSSPRPAPGGEDPGPASVRSCGQSAGANGCPAPDICQLAGIVGINHYSPSAVFRRDSKSA